MQFPIDLHIPALASIQDGGIYSPIFYIFLFIHIVSFITAFGAVIFIDSAGLMWILKRAKLSSVNIIANTGQKLIWTGWAGLIISGSVLVLAKGYIDQLTALKLFFVAMVGLNGIYLHIIKKSSEHLTDTDEMPALIRFRVTLASTISQVGWWGAIVIGFLHRHIQHNIPYPANPWIWMAGIFLLFSILAILIEIIFRKKSGDSQNITYL
jgi:hypothetical protein